MIVVLAGLTADSGESLLAAQIHDKLAVYHSHLKSERVTKTLALSDELRAEVETKRRDVELSRNKKQVENAARRAEDAVAKAQALSKDFTSA